MIVILAVTKDKGFKEHNLRRDSVRRYSQIQLDNHTVQTSSSDEPGAKLRAPPDRRQWNKFCDCRSSPRR